ncbi:type II restriction endonuclease [Litoribacter populi]|uniref:type II restriction endonuclease n=1 Tax=Litoribacter populi TaxID=2598460 RepID=UPI00117E3D10|nr:type II restriction endonuclease [Litoribacter populi]
MNNPLSKYIVAAGAKRLSQVEINEKKSNQHELNGGGFRHIFGSEKSIFQTKFLYLADEEDEQLVEDVSMTWYDSRKNKKNRSPEFRFYYTPNSIIKKAQESDLIIIAKSTDDTLLVVVCPNGSTHESQLLWLFGLEESEKKFVVKEFKDQKGDLGFAGKLIISNLGLEVEEEEPDYLVEMLKLFGPKLPTTAIFSEYARKTYRDKVSPLEAPDDTLMAWLEWEEILFKTFERYLVAQKLGEGFGKDGLDVDDFIKFSLSVQNRRKSRAGYAFENHLAVIFDEHCVKYSRGVKTDRNNKPDFLFPGIEEYLDAGFSSELLTMLGLKTTAKDRWRQVLPEADRIDKKHLITLEPAISKNQTEEMRIKLVQLVIPKPILYTYSDSQQKEIILVEEFLKLVKGKQILL